MCSASTLRIQCHLGAKPSRAVKSRLAFCSAPASGHRWHRVQEFQRISLKLIAEDLLLGCPSTVAEQLSKGLSFSGELTCAKLSLEQSVTLLVSPHNPGAEALANELKDTFTKIDIRRTGDTNEAQVTSQQHNSSRLPQWFSGPNPYFLLYLNGRTFLGDDGELLADQVRAVHRRHPRAIVLVHENVVDDPRCGCEFSRCHGPLFFTERGQNMAHSL